MYTHVLSDIFVFLVRGMGFRAPRVMSLPSILFLELEFLSFISFGSQQVVIPLVGFQTLIRNLRIGMQDSF